MGEFTWSSFSCVWDFAMFLPTWILWSIMRSEVTLSTALLKSHSTDLLKASLHLFWCSHNCLSQSSSGAQGCVGNVFSQCCWWALYLRLQAFSPHCFVGLLVDAWFGGHSYTHVQTSCKYGDSMFQSKNLEFPMAAWLLEFSSGTGEHQVCFATWKHSNVICDNL